jgi:hypothetical protein
MPSYNLPIKYVAGKFGQFDHVQHYTLIRKMQRGFLNNPNGYTPFYDNYT